jgi:hypothetical protein
MLHILIGRHHLMFWYKPIFYRHEKFTDCEIWQLVMFDFILVKMSREVR